MIKYNELTTEQKLDCLSLFPKEAKKDENWSIRQEAYQILGYTEEAKKDEHWAIRMGNFRALGYTEEAKTDSDSDIREEAEIYFKIKKPRVTYERNKRKKRKIFV